MNVVNLKKLIINRYDWIINQVDIYTEQQLEKYSSTDTVEVPNGREPESMPVCDYLNKSRDEMIDMVREDQAEALKQLEIIRDKSQQILQDDEDKEATLRRLLFRIIPLPIILHINEINLNYGKIKNSCPFKMYLIKLDFNIDINKEFLLMLRYLFKFFLN